jgi:hypothetical protein
MLHHAAVFDFWLKKRKRELPSASFMEKACEKHEIFKEILYLFTSVVLEGST